MTFRYRSRFFVSGVLIFLATVVGLFVLRKHDAQKQA